MENPNTTPSAAQQPENNGSERMFTQSELNTIVADRLARERSKSAERVGDLDAREKDLKAREEALAAKSQRFNQWEAREACKQYLTDNHISTALLDKLDTSDPEVSNPVPGIYRRTVLLREQDQPCNQQGFQL